MTTVSAAFICPGEGGGVGGGALTKHSVDHNAFCHALPLQKDRHLTIMALTGIKEKMKNNHQLWKMRPLSQDLINYAIDEVSHLLSLQDKLTAELGKSQLKLLARLSLNYSQSCWLPADKATSTNASKFCEVATLTPFKPGSWLGTLFFISKGSNAA